MTIAISDDIMRKAYDRRRNQGWPDTFELCMCSPFYSRLVRLEALHGETSRIEACRTSDRTLPTAARIQVRPKSDLEGTRYWWHDRD